MVPGRLSRRALASACLVLAASAGLPLPARAEADSLARVSVTNVVNHRFENGDPGSLGYKATYEFLGPVAPGDPLPSTRIDAERNPEAFQGPWADLGVHAAWIAPKGKRQFFPDPYTVESGYLDNYLDFDAAPLVAGDRVDFAIKQLSADAPLTWARQRGAAAGEPAWDIARHTEAVSATYGTQSETMDVVFVRADLVARGGDLDNRDASLRLPPLVVDLGKTYGPDARASAVTASFTPYLHYLSGLEGQVLPQSGKAVFTATTRGYLPEARSITLANGTSVREWHVPLDIIITIGSTEGPLAGRSMTTMPSGGSAWVTTSAGTERVDVPAGRSLLTGPDTAPRLRTAADAAPDVPAPGSASSASTDESSGGGTLLDDMRSADQIDHNLDRPVDLLVGKRSFGFTIDPNYQDAGFLALRAFRHARSGLRYFETAAVPYVTVDGDTIALTKDRLTDLRVVPFFDTLRIRFTSRTDNTALDPFSYARAREGRIYDTGVGIEAVYHLGGDRYAHLTTYGIQDAGDPGPGAITSHLWVRSLSRAPAHVSAVHYMEMAEPGPVVHDGEPHSAEFSAPSRAISTNNTSVSGGATGGGQVTVVAAGGPLTPTPAPDPSVSIEGVPVAVYMTSPAGSSTGEYFSAMTARLLSAGDVLVVPPPALGESCAEPAVVDDAGEDADPHLDVERAWFDYDGRRLYATIQVRDLPAAPLGQVAAYRAGFRFEHVGYGLQASRDATGAWIFEFGLHSSAGSSWHRVDDAAGEVQTGSPGFIRMSVPTSAKFSGSGFLDGELLRDTGATSFDVDSVADRAPAGATEFAYGRGADYRIALCPGIALPTQLVLLEGSDPSLQYSDGGTLHVRLSDHAGEAVADRPLQVLLDGRRETVVTDHDGVATVAIPSDLSPGEHALLVSFEGDDSYVSSDLEIGVEVAREDTTMALSPSGNGSKKMLVAELADPDGSSVPSERSVDFYSDGAYLGSAVTDAHGVAEFPLPPKERGARHLFEARFEGDAFYLPATGATRT